MIRRQFFSQVAAAAVAPFVGVPPMRDDVDLQGKPLAKAYKLGSDGQFREVPRWTLKEGDKFIMLGMDGERLWCARLLTVGPGGHKDSQGIRANDCPVMDDGIDIVEKGMA